MSDIALYHFTRYHQGECDKLVNVVRHLIPSDAVVLGVGSNIGLFMNSILKGMP